MKKFSINLLKVGLFYLMCLYIYGIGYGVSAANRISETCNLRIGNSITVNVDSGYENGIVYKAQGTNYKASKADKTKIYASSAGPLQMRITATDKASVGEVYYVKKGANYLGGSVTEIFAKIIIIDKMPVVNAGQETIKITKGSNYSINIEEKYSVGCLIGASVNNEGKCNVSCSVKNVTNTSMMNRNKKGQVNIMAGNQTGKATVTVQSSNGATVYKKIYKVNVVNPVLTIDFNGGHKENDTTVKSVIAKDGGNDNIYTIIENENLNGEKGFKIVRKGYEFMGWADTKNATKATYSYGQKLHITTNTTIYAVWKKVDTSAVDKSVGDTENAAGTGNTGNIGETGNAEVIQNSNSSSGIGSLKFDGILGKVFEVIMKVLEFIIKNVIPKVKPLAESVISGLTQ